MATRDLIEGQDYFLHYVRFPNRANPALTVPNDDGTFDIYLNTLYSTEELREELEHELRHLRDEHFYVDLPIQRIERQADGEPVCVVGNTPPGIIPHFYSLESFGHWATNLARQRGMDMRAYSIMDRPPIAFPGKEPGKKKNARRGR